MRYLVLYCVGQNYAKPREEAEFAELGEKYGLLALQPSALYSLQIRDLKRHVDAGYKFHLTLVNMAVRYEDVQEYLKENEIPWVAVESFKEALETITREEGS